MYVEKGETLQVETPVPPTEAPGLLLREVQFLNPLPHTTLHTKLPAWEKLRLNAHPANARFQEIAFLGVGRFLFCASDADLTLFLGTLFCLLNAFCASISLLLDCFNWSTILLYSPI